MYTQAKKKNTKHTKGGYLLIEMLVSLGIFAVVVVSTTAALLSIVSANAEAQSMRSAIDNLSVAVENMSRVIRMGSDIKCSDSVGSSESYNCIDGKSVLSFVPQDATGPTDRLYYYISGTSIYRRRGGVDTALTAPEMKISELSFYLTGGGTGDGQPRVFLTIGGIADSNSSAGSSFLIQTTIAQRLDDCDDPTVCIK